MPLMDGPRTIAWAAVSFLLHAAVDKGVEVAGLIPQSLSPRSRLLFRNHSGSFCHAVTVTYLLAKELVENGLRVFDHMDEYHSVYVRQAVAWSLGYFIFDTYSMAAKDLFKTDRMTRNHHVIVVFGLALSLYVRMYQPYTFLALLAEPHSIFLHWRKLLQFAGLADTKLFVVSEVVQYAIFFIFRGLVHSYGLWKSYEECEREKFRNPITLFGLGGAVGIWWLNYVLLRKLMKSGGARPKTRPMQTT
eukprot:Clim_evm13s141 gene=Clim_evmTU13s141